MKKTMRQIALTATTLGSLSLAAALAPTVGLAQGLFDPVFKINDQVVTRYEIEQRGALLTVLNAPGDPIELAREQLVDDRLKMIAANSFGLEVAEEAVDEGKASFAARGNLKVEQMLQLLQQSNVDPQTFDAFVRVGLTWRQLVNNRFARQVSVSEEDVDKAIDAQINGGTVRVLLSEIIIPIPEGREKEVEALTDQLSQIRSFDKFAIAARQYSAAQTRGQGGRLGWMPISDLPAPLRPVLLGLAPGEVTDPMPLQGAVAIFQMRAIAESDAKTPSYEAIEYSTYYLPGGRSPETLAQAEKIRGSVDTCDDLYGLNYGQPDELLEQISSAPGDLPRDIALELAKLDEGEISTNLTRNNGSQLMVLMLCGRSPTIEGETSREEIAAQLRNRQLESFANAYLEELRSEARIVEK
ncbi:MAG: peptidylprolyl isomerase [Thalassovita sp.]